LVCAVQGIGGGVSMRKLVVVAVVLLVGSSWLYAEPFQGAIARSQFGFVQKASGLRVDFDTKVATIAEKLGQPSVEEEILVSREFKKYRWKGLELLVLPNSDITIEIRVVDKTFATIDGAFVGCGIDTVKRIYGATPASAMEGAIEYWYSDPSEAQYADGSETWGLRFYYKDGVVTKIGIGRLD